MSTVTSVLSGVTLPDANKHIEPKLSTCEVGMFRLPGILLDIEQWSKEELAEMDAWGAANGGKKMTEKLWSFRSEAKRDWFILRWS